MKHLCYFRVQLLDVGEPLDPAGGASVRQLRVEHQLRPQVGRWRREPRSVHGGFSQAPGTCESAADLLVLHQMLLRRLVFLPPRSQRHVCVVCVCFQSFKNQKVRPAALTLKYLLSSSPNGRAVLIYFLLSSELSSVSSVLPSTLFRPSPALSCDSTLFFDSALACK